MKRISDALELLTAQHDELAAMLRDLPSFAGERRAHALGALADALTTHLAAEQELFYPSVALRTADAELEHEAMKTVLAELLLGEPFDARIATLAALFERHCRAQEDALFVTVAELMPPEVLDGIGTQLRAWSESSRCVAA